eukprot:TRINITY_DN11824_c0_g1_i1.p1 TRINITY_DN11824_c0_g1~~TRINITY_DN11824_c0_g1_i1.p1  ORF type:complete len:664 (-),score=100.45 TRINITY_DN11824_c0_g1_i1:151-2142(-)
MKTIDEAAAAVDGAAAEPPSCCSSEAKADAFLVSNDWADYLRDCRSSTESYLAEQTQLTERLLHRLRGGAPSRLSVEQLAEDGRSSSPASDALAVNSESAPVSPRRRGAQSVVWSAASFVGKMSTPKSKSNGGILKKALSGHHFQSSESVQHVLSVMEAEAEPERSGRIYKVVTGKGFEVICGLLITLNTIFTVLRANASMDILALSQSTAAADEARHFIQLYLDWLDRIEMMFLGVYAVELCLRLYAHRLYFFCGRSAGWHLLDMVALGAAVSGRLITNFLQGSDDATLSSGKSSVMLMRMTRLLKLGKLARVVRAARFFRQMMMFVDCVLGCLENLFWALLMILLVLLLFSIFFVQSFESWLTFNVDAEEQSRHQILEKFGSVQMSMLTLFYSTTGGTDWADIYKVVRKTDSMSSFMFLGMIIFFAVAVWNIIASIFFEKAIKSSMTSRDDEILDKRRNEEQDAKELMDLCKRADVDSSGSISDVEFEKLMSTESILEFFSVRGLDIKNARHFFEVMNAMTPGNEVDLEEFVGSCLRVKGAATSIDLHLLAFESRAMHSKTNKFMESASEVLTTLTQQTERTLALMRDNTSKMNAAPGKGGEKSPARAAQPAARAMADAEPVDVQPRRLAEGADAQPIHFEEPGSQRGSNHSTPRSTQDSL